MSKKIAIVGGGIAGLTAAYLLRKKYQITIYEKGDRVGGNAYTHVTFEGNKYDMAVAVFMKSRYPLFYKLLRELGLKTLKIPGLYMAYHNLDTTTGIYLNTSLKGLHTQRYDVLRPKNLLRLYSMARKINRAVKDGIGESLTWDQLCTKHFKFDEYQRTILICTLSLLASMSVDQVLAAPGDFLIKKLYTYRLFTSEAFFNLELVRGTTLRYVSKLAEVLKQEIVLNSNIKSIVRHPLKIEIILNDNTSQFYDKVILATGADEALNLLDKPDTTECELLGPWTYNELPIVLHTDGSHLPDSTLWGVFNLLYTGSGSTLKTSVNGITAPGVIGTQHQNFPIDENKILFNKTFRTPIFDFRSVNTIPRLGELNDNKNTYFCGSYFGHGLHEDAVRSAVDVASLLGVEF